MGKRRRFDREFKRQAVRLVSEEGESVSQVARDLGVRPVDRKVAWCLTKLGDPDLAGMFSEALVAYHVGEAKPLMGAYLDAWGIPHQDGAIESEDCAFPAPEALLATLPALAGRFPAADLGLYLAASGLVMGEDRPEWRAAAWPAIDQLLAT